MLPRWLKRTAIALGLLVVAFFAFTFFNWYVLMTPEERAASIEEREREREAEREAARLAAEEAAQAPRLLRAAAHAYVDNRDGDVRNEVVAYVELFDLEDEPTTCDCTITLNVTRNAAWGKTYHVTSEQFERGTVGQGDLQREALYFVVLLDDDIFRSCSRNYDVTFTARWGGSTVTDKDALWYPC